MVAVSLSALVAALAGVAGGWLSLRIAALRGEMERSMALGAGLLLGGALLAMLPAAARAPGGPGAIALGFTGFLLLRQGSAGHLHDEEGLGADSAGAVFTGLLLHSLVDGAALGMAVQAGGEVGLLALLAISLHKLAEGFSLATVVFLATSSASLVIGAVTGIGLATFFGSWGALLWAQAALLSHGAVLGVAAGSFLYVGAAEMLPHALRRGGSAWLVAGGVLLVYLLMGSVGLGHSH